MRKREYESYLRRFVKMWKERAKKGFSRILCPACNVDEESDFEEDGLCCRFCPINWDYLPKKERFMKCNHSKSRLNKYEIALEESVAAKIALKIAENPRWYTYEEWKDRVKITLKRDF
jgi:hypothetical protein